MRHATDIDEGSEGFPGQVGNPAAVVSTPLAGFPTAGSIVHAPQQR